MFDENVRETVCCLWAAAGSFYLKKNITRHNHERYLQVCVYLLEPGIRWSVFWWDQPPLYVWIHSEAGLFSSSACRDSPSRSDPRVLTIYPGQRNCLKKILNICRKINRIYRHDHPTLNLDLLHLASVQSHPPPEYLRSSTPSQPDRNQSPGPHHRCKAFLIGSSLLNGREEVFSWLLSGKSPQDWPGNGQIRIKRVLGLISHKLSPGYWKKVGDDEFAICENIYAFMKVWPNGGKWRILSSDTFSSLNDIQYLVKA